MALYTFILVDKHSKETIAILKVTKDEQTILRHFLGLIKNPSIPINRKKQVSKELIDLLYNIKTKDNENNSLWNRSRIPKRK